jgi:ElaB/YqjD/DUF883 family membrane-anchored ribosome-binding protein
MSMETDRIEADLNESRTRLNDTLSALGSKLSPGQMVDEVLGLAQGQAGEFASKLGRQVKDNPLPTILIAAGVGMLLLNHQRQHGSSSMSDDDWHHERRYRSLEEARWHTPRNAGESDSDYEGRVHSAYAKTLDLKQKADEAVHEFKERVSRTVEGIQTRAADIRDRMTQRAADAKHYAQDQARRLGERASHQAQRLGERASDAKHRAEDFYQDTPLAAGALAVAIGALIGSATPLSNAEREGLRGVADTAARKGADLAERGARAVEQQVDGAVH